MKHFIQKVSVVATTCLLLANSGSVFAEQVSTSNTSDSSDSVQQAAQSQEIADATSTSTTTSNTAVADTDTATTEETTATSATGSTESTESTSTTSSDSTTTTTSSSEEDDAVEIPSNDGVNTYPSNRSDINPSVQARTASIAPYLAPTDANPGIDVVDISSHNGNVSVDEFKKMKSYGVKTVIVKISEYTTYVNPYAKTQIANAKAAGLKVGGYHYSWFKTDSDAQKEAQYFAKQAAAVGLSKTDFMVNDIEESSIAGKADHTSNSQAFEKQLNQLGYSQVRHYVGLYWLTSGLINSSTLGNNNIWVAAYPNTVTSSQLYTQYGAWQWTSQMSFPGVSGTFDVSVDYGNIFGAGNTEVTTPDQGDYHSDNRYVTLTKANKSIYSNFNWSVKNNTSNLLGNTYKSTGKYYHKNGTTYLSLYDSNNKWIGYIPETDVTIASGAQGAWQAYDKYVTITKSGGSVYSGFNFGVNSSTDALLNKTYHATGEYKHYNGKTYLSIYDKNNKWVGYVEDTMVKQSSNTNGPYIAYNKYVQLKSGYNVTSGIESGSTINKTANLLNQTFEAKGIYYTFSGKAVLSLYDGNGKWVGYVDANAATTVSGPQGNWIKDGNYYTVTNSNASIYSNFSFKVKASTSTIYQQTFLAQGKYNHMNGKTYYTLYDSQGNWQGYVESSALKKASGAEGIWQSYNKYVTITQTGGTIYSGFDFSKKTTTDALLNKTYRATGMYKHYNGKTYLSIYDKNNKWAGYVEDTMVKQSSSTNGPYVAYNKYVQLKSGYNITSGIESGSTINTTAKLLNHTFEAKGIYYTFSGKTVLSLYDGSGKWIGYVESKAANIVSGPQGKWIADGHSYKVTSKEGSTYSNFNWTAKKQLSSLYNKTFLAQGKYYHLNGETYYTLYDDNGNWQGYIEASKVTKVN
ncbi:MAG: GH25 family lysozyme [Enterococcus sp.]